MVSNLKLCGRSSVVDGSRCLHGFMKLVVVRHIQGWRLPPAWACSLQMRGVFALSFFAIGCCVF